MSRMHKLLLTSKLMGTLVMFSEPYFLVVLVLLVYILYVEGTALMCNMSRSTQN